ncbi:hypothetical protein SAMN05216376_101532 [Mameliella alba]|uniref:hypothetical protein n=1 Tax=Mameliella alba TaxID=561184 RepID=UPI00087F7FCC|nr:hypothetical protein [Mameliella alba]OWV50016.1 hypothetical protein CDZ96_00495 [Mameliella alba]PTR42607.1 hypothetical protein LX94_00530 [Mameliella alba]GGF72266.1 hypothetical protein GCM10011319_36100 [Mameliella alba]SDC17490.1 hypothetical protein SAMN05216376_101532 [Mameliella alba]
MIPQPFQFRPALAIGVSLVLTALAAPLPAQDYPQGPAKLRVTSTCNDDMTLAGRYRVSPTRWRYFPRKRLPAGASGLIREDDKPIVFRQGVVLYAETEDGRGYYDKTPGTDVEGLLLVKRHDQLFAAGREPRGVVENGDTFHVRIPCN